MGFKLSARPNQEFAGWGFGTVGFKGSALNPKP